MSAKTLVHEQSITANAFDAYKYKFKINTTSDLEINLYVPSPVGVTYTVKNSSGKVVGNPMVLTNYDDSWILDGRGWYTYKYVVNQLKKEVTLLSMYLIRKLNLMPKLYNFRIMSV